MIAAAQPDGRLPGASAAMDAVRRLIARVAPTDSAALICGESGCGKDLVAESLHAGSPRADGPFVAINCGAFPATHIDAELFGHAKDGCAGAFERADGGTLLLDECTELPLEIQARLMRVFETRCVRRVGAELAIPVDVRVLAAMSREPVEAVAAGHLREDLYRRLAVVLIKLPPLHERTGDIRQRPGDGSSITLPIGSSLADIERTFILTTLEHFGGDKRRAASALGCSVKTLYNKLHLYRRQLSHVAAAS